jgi:hypothetical protein
MRGHAAGARDRPAPLGTTVVEVWGPDPAGCDQAYAILESIAGPLQGTSTTPAGWGIAGSEPVTDYRLWASPQAFTGSAGLVAHTTWHEGGGTPIIYDAETDYDFDVVTIPDQITAG